MTDKCITSKDGVWNILPIFQNAGRMYGVEY